MLDDRKTAILGAVVQEYIATAQPVGSTHISSAPNINVSSATVRNEMAMLESEGYIGGFDVADNSDKPGQNLTIQMKYSPKRERVISGLKRVSKPGLRVYSGTKEVPRVVGGLGVAVVSTSKGLMSDREARRRRLGGEVLCYVW